MPGTAIDPLQRLQLDIAAVLQADELFKGVQVVVDCPRDSGEGALVQSKIDASLAGLVEVETDAGTKAGLCIIVFKATGQCPTPGLPGPELALVQGIRVIENVMVNEGPSGTGMTAEGAAIKVLGTLERLNLGSLLLPDKQAMRPIKMEGLQCWDVVVTTQLGIAPRAFVQRPLIQLAGISLTITCATEGAAIWWTLDGSLPAPNNPNAMLYEGVVDVGEHGGDEIRACAYLTGRRASDVSCRTI